MHTVSAIEEYNSKKKRIVLDAGVITFLLYNSEVRKFGLSEGVNLDDETYGNIVWGVVYPRCRDRALHILTGRDLSERSLEDRLLDNGYPGELVTRVIDYVKEHRLIDDCRYAKNYVWGKAETRSRRQMREYLRSHGLDEATIEEAFRDYYDANEDAEVKLATRLLQKKINISSTGISYEQRGRLMAYLARKGFGYDTISKAFESIE